MAIQLLFYRVLLPGGRQNFHTAFLYSSHVAFSPSVSLGFKIPRKERRKNGFGIA